jgi:hypothetical protein
MIHTLREVCGGVFGGSLLPLPRWTEGVEESTSSCTCDRARGRCQLWRRVHDLVIVKWTTTSSERLRRLRASSLTLHRQRLCGNVIPASDLRGLVNHCYHLVEFSWLVLCLCVEIFCFICYEPISVIFYFTFYNLKYIFRGKGSICTESRSEFLITYGLWSSVTFTLTWKNCLN